MILKKTIKYAGAVAATLLAVAPIAAPVLGTATEIKVEASVANNVNQNDVQEWLNEVKGQIQLGSDSTLITPEEGGTFYVHGTDGIFEIDPQDMTPQTEFLSAVGISDDFFSHFNDNNNRDDLFFNNNHIGVIMTASSNDNSISGNLSEESVNKLLSDGKSVTFHLSLKYSEKENSNWQVLLDSNDVLGTKDVTILPFKNDNQSSNIPGTNFVTTFSPSVDVKTYDDKGNATPASLSKASAWSVDRQMDINGVTYYRVATNEWVKKSDGIEVFPNKTTVNTNKQASLYTSTGKAVTNRALAKNTPWYTDRSATINGVKMYRVATDEWVAASDVQ